MTIIVAINEFIACSSINHNLTSSFLLHYFLDGRDGWPLPKELLLFVSLLRTLRTGRVATAADRQIQFSLRRYALVNNTRFSRQQGRHDIWFRTVRGATHSPKFTFGFSLYYSVHSPLRLALISTNAVDSVSYPFHLVHFAARFADGRQSQSTQFTRSRRISFVMLPTPATLVFSVYFMFFTEN